MSFQNIFFKPLAAFFLGTLVALLVLEAGLRLFGSRYIGDLLVPGGDAGAYRVLCLGDSFVYGLGAPPEKSYPRQLQEILDRKGLTRKVQVIPYGFPGYNTSQLYAVFSRDIDLLRPDLVIFLGGMINEHNFYGYHAYRRTGSLLSKMRDQAERVRIVKLISLVSANIREKYTQARIARTIDTLRAQDIRTPRARAYYALALKESSRDNRREAIALANKALEADPSCTVPYFMLGETYESEGKIPEAMRSYRKFLERLPGPFVAFRLGTLYSNAGDFREAFRCYRTAMEIDRSAYRDCLGGVLRLLSAKGAEGLREDVVAYLRQVRLAVDKDSRRKIDDAIAHRGGSDNDLDSWRAHDVNRIIDGCLRRRIRIVLMDYPESPSVLKEIAASRGLPYVDNCAVFAPLLRREPRERYISSDASHCNANGYRIVAENAAKTIEELALVR